MPGHSDWLYIYINFIYWGCFGVSFWAFPPFRFSLVNGITHSERAVLQRIIQTLHHCWKWSLLIFCKIIYIHKEICYWGKAFFEVSKCKMFTKYKQHRLWYQTKFAGVLYLGINNTLPYLVSGRIHLCHDYILTSAATYWYWLTTCVVFSIESKIQDICHQPATGLSRASYETWSYPTVQQNL